MTVMLTQDEYPIVKLLMDAKIANNEFRAGHIIKGCRLAELDTDEARLARARLYREWRNSQIFSGNTAPCFEMAVKGEAVPMKRMEFDVTERENENAA